jgi:lipopolysaccharide transport system ATP-binding protein
MKDTDAIIFESVTKTYPIYSHLGAGLKGFIFNLPKAIKGLTRERFTALENISFQIKRGETVAFMGRNGAGKSTTLGLIAQVLKSTSGTVTVHGRVSPLLELGGGFHSDLTGRENILLNGVLLGLSRKAVKEKIESIIEFSELGKFIDQPIRMYSSGMLSRLGFSVVAHLDPEILLVDEVLAVGDLSFQEKCKLKISDFKKKGVTIVLVSHSIDDVRTLCDRVIWIDNHQIKMDGPTAQVLPVYEKYFI